MVRKQLYIDENLNDGLRVLAASTGRSEADHVRAALREYLQRGHPDHADGEDALLEMIGLVDDRNGPEDVAAEHDRYLYGAARPA
ncbi:MAG: ribbon-helix-helix protein, CopG family [Pseudonocardiaceae bacterium]|nr:ribbon-helix-helix protein, CopG family [Pseudonocardiaceae bacterium]